MNRRTRLAVCGGGVLVLLSLAGLSMAFRAGSEGPPAQPPQRVAADGVIEGARRTVPVLPEVAGTLAVLHVRENQVVRAGDLLFELVNETEQAEVELATAEWEHAKLQFKELEAAWNRTRKASVGVSELDRDRDYYRQAQALTQMHRSEAQLKLARAKFARTRVVARSSGRILQIDAEVGEAVRPDRRHPVLLLADLSRRRVRAFVEELDVGRVQVGQRALVTAEGFPGKEFAGQVAEVLPVMGKSGPRSDEPGEYIDVYFREVLIDLEAGEELPVRLRVRVRINGSSASLSSLQFSGEPS